METEKNEYELHNFRRTPDEISATQKIVFYELNEDSTSEDGTTIEELLRVGIERLSDLSRRVSCRETSIAITKMQEALMWLNERTKDRIKRGVEGTHLI